MDDSRYSRLSAIRAFASKAEAIFGYQQESLVAQDPSL